ncbi:hypothetical protein Peur_064941 [Populus x canadensis]
MLLTGKILVTMILWNMPVASFLSRYVPKSSRCPAKQLEARFASETNALLASHESLELKEDGSNPDVV